MGSEMHDMMGGGMGNMMGMGAWMVLWLLVGLALLGLAVAGIVWLVRRAGSGSGASHSTWQRESPEDVLRRRYAAGEIDEEEFARRMSVLTDGRS